VNGAKYLEDDSTKYLHPMSGGGGNLEDNKFASPVTCQMVVDDQSIMKSSPNSQPTLSQLTTANLHMEMEDGNSVIKNEEASSFVLPPYMH
jgi:hypothetical protein